MIEYFLHYKKITYIKMTKTVLNSLPSIYKLLIGILVKWEIRVFIKVNYDFFIV